MRITRVYTRTGDRGTTRLVSGEEVPKDHDRIEAYGTVDELNSLLGLVRTFNRQSDGGAEATERIDHILERVQNDLFEVGSDLATPPDSRWEGMVRMGEEDVALLERWCDELNEDVGPLKEFILPGGGPVGAFLHQARTVCRRAERRVVRLFEAEREIGPEALTYLNRLSDLLFVLGRWAARAHGEPEHLWSRRTAESD